MTIDSEEVLILRKQYLEERNPEIGNKILEKLVTVDANQVDEDTWLECKDLIARIFDDIPTETLISQNQILLLQAIEHSPANVIDALATILKRKPNITESMEKSPAVAVALTRRVDDLTCNQAISLLIAPISSNPLVVQELSHQFSQLNGPNKAQNRQRLYQVLADTMQIGKYTESLRFLADGLTRDVLDSRDCLAQLAAIDMLTDCVLTNESSAKQLDEFGILDKMYEMLKESRNSPDGGFLYTAAVRFFGHVCRQYPASLERFAEFVPLVFDMISHFDLLDASQRALAFDTFANVAYSMEGKRRVAMDEGSLRSALNSFSVAVNHGPLELRIRHIDAATLLFVNANDGLAVEWYRKMGGVPFTASVLNTIITLFDEIRVALLSFLRTVFKYESIIQEYIETAGFNEWIVNDTAETDFRCKELKRELIEMMIGKAEKEKTLKIDDVLLMKLKSALIPKQSINAEVGIML